MHVVLYDGIGVRVVLDQVVPRDTHLSVYRVSSSNDTTSGIQTGMNTGFGDCDGLLFHDFMDSDSIDIGHFIEFIDADYSSVGENHRAGFESSFTYR